MHAVVTWQLSAFVGYNCRNSLTGGSWSFVAYYQTVSLFWRSSCTCKVSVCISLTRTYHM